MTPERYARVCDLFDQVQQHDPAERDTVLRRACAGDSDLLGEVEKLLAHDAEARAENFLTAPEGVHLPSLLPATPPEDGLVGRRIGPYEVRDKIASGGMGSVYRAVRVDDYRQQVAIKLIKPGLGGEDLLRRFRTERQVLAGLNHPHIARLLDGGTTEDGQPYLVMEFIEGRPIDRYCDEHRLSVRQRLQLFCAVCAAVQHAHQLTVIHRDLKPGNILVDGAGRPKVLDFGIARVADADLQQTAPGTNVGQLVGTLPYMSPEQVAADPQALDTRSDVYALGVICYQLLAGRLPHDLTGKSLPEAVRIIGEQEAPPLGAVIKSCRGDLETIVARALEKDKDRRYPSASDLAADVERYLRDEPILARPRSAWYQFRKFARRNKALVGGVAATFLALVLGVIGTGFSLVRALDAEADANEKRGLAEAAQATALTNLGRAETAERGLRAELALSHFQTAKLAAQRGDWLQALASYDRALQAGYPDEVEVRLKKVQAWITLNERQLAARELESLAGRGDLGKHAGTVLLLRGDFALPQWDERERALELLRAALKEGLAPADAEYARGLLAEKSLDAVGHFEAALRHDPYHHHAHGALLTYLLFLGRLQECKNRSQAFALLFPQDPTPGVVLAIIALCEGDVVAARARLAEFRSQLGEKPTEALQAVFDLGAEAIEMTAGADAFGGTRGKASIPRLILKFLALKKRFQEVPSPADLGLRFINLPALANSWGVLFTALRFQFLGRTREAVEQVERALECNPEGTLYFWHAHLIMELPKKGRDEMRAHLVKAERSYRLALETPCLCPLIRRHARFWGAHAQAMLARPGSSLFDPEMRTRAVHNIRTLLNQDSPNAAECQALFGLAVRVRDYDLARETVAAWEKADPKDLNALRSRAQVELLADAWYPALQAARQVLARKPDDKDASKYLREAEEKLRQHAQALP
jgi:hypothetical protein